jgi:hypothetical protein
MMSDAPDHDKEMLEVRKKSGKQPVTRLHLHLGIDLDDRLMLPKKCCHTVG